MNEQKLSKETICKPDGYTVLADAIFRPILFSTPMVKAVLNGSKNQTRRLQGLEKFNENPDWFRYDGTSNYEDQQQFYEHYFETVDVHGDPTEKYTQVKSKVKPGDIFWVRETFYKTTAPELKGGYYYKASTDKGWNLKWKPSIFMPKEACRIFLEVTDVRVERLQDISNEDALKEGISNHYLLKSNGYTHYTRPDKFIPIGSEDAERTSFFSLWMSINGADSLDKNPWVWVYEFKRVDRPSGFC